MELGYLYYFLIYNEIEERKEYERGLWYVIKGIEILKKIVDDVVVINV